MTENDLSSGNIHTKRIDKQIDKCSTTCKPGKGRIPIILTLTNL